MTALRYFVGSALLSDAKKLQVPREWIKYILPKGFIGIDGCSLTVSFCNTAPFMLCIQVCAGFVNRTVKHRCQTAVMQALCSFVYSQMMAAPTCDAHLLQYC